MMPAMDTLATPANIASLIARNLVPAVGVLFLGWSAGNLLVLYYLDTILSAAVVMLLIARHITGLGKAGQRRRPLEGPLNWIGGTLIVLVYAGATVYFELFPDRALAWLNPKESKPDHSA